jgi:hypothetical protein
MADRHHDRNLRTAMARSPELSAALTGEHDDPSPRYRRLALLVSGVGVSVGLLWLALSVLPGGSRRPARHEPAEEIDTSHYLAPLRTAAVAGGEETAPFSGFAISVDTEPAGAIVTIAGVPRGEAPVLANLDCRPGARIAVSAEKAGAGAARVETTCRADTLVKLTVRLAR